MALHKLYVYGTLMRPEPTERVEVPGYLFDLGWFPGIELADADKTDSRVKCQVIYVTDDELTKLDAYEGYNPNDPANSLYIRREYDGGYIYEYNRSTTAYPVIASGDWGERSTVGEVV